MDTIADRIEINFELVTSLGILIEVQIPCILTRLNPVIENSDNWDPIVLNTPINEHSGLESHRVCLGQY